MAGKVHNIYDPVSGGTVKRIKYGLDYSVYRIETGHQVIWARFSFPDVAEEWACAMSLKWPEEFLVEYRNNGKLVQVRFKGGNITHRRGPCDSVRYRGAHNG